MRVFKATIAESRFERIWLQSKKRLLQHVTQKPGNIWLRSQPVVYRVGRKNTSRSEPSALRWSFRKVLGLESVKDLSGNVKL